jgi:hypothetical protein
VSYLEHRVRRLWAAEEYEGHDLPPYGDGKLIGRVVMFPESASNRRYVIPPGQYPITPMIEAHYKAKEKRQNRQFYEMKPR